MSKQAVVGILAHVDAGKTTLAEAMLFNAGRIRKRGRVDDGDSHLDTNTIERERGILRDSGGRRQRWRTGSHRTPVAPACAL